MFQKIQEAYKQQTITHEDATFLSGFAKALSLYGIWKDGVQVIGCKETPINKAFDDEFNEHVL